MSITDIPDIPDVGLSVGPDLDTSKPPVEKGVNRRLEIVDTLSRSTVLFGQVMLPNLFTKPPCSFHYEVDAMLHDESMDQGVVVAPRGHAKSTLVSNAHPLNCVLSSAMKGQKEYILIISKTQTLSDELLGTIKDALSNNSRIQALYGDYGENTAKSWAKSRVVLKNDTVVQSRGLGQHIIGLRHLELRPTLILVDDGEDENNTKTAEAMRANLRWLLGAALPALDRERGRIFVIGTPKHELCLVETLSNTDGWEKKRYDSIIDEEKHIVLWPEMWDYDALMARMRTMKSAHQLSIFYREYRCQIVGDEEQIFKPEYFQYYRGGLVYDESGNRHLQITHANDENGRFIELATPVKKNVVTFMGVDPASSTLAGSAFSAIMTVAIDDKMNMFILPYYRKQVAPMELANAVIAQYERDKPDITNVEAVGFQEMLRNYLMEKTMIPGLRKKIIPRDPKSARLEKLEPYFASYKVWMTPEMTEFEDELLLYPRGKTKDIMDAMELAISRIYPPTVMEEEIVVSTKRERLAEKKLLEIGYEHRTGGWKVA